jgi:cysteine desulfurase
MERLYFDYNATAPLSPSVLAWLRQGNLPFANPASSHYSGQNSRKVIEETSDYLKKTFNLDHDIFFHSGASEGVNTIIRGWAQKNPNGHFFCSTIDHSSIINLGEYLKPFGVSTHFFKVDKNGDFDLGDLKSQIKSLNGAPCLLNYTYVNNVIGVIWDLKWAEEIKKETNCKIHVDSVQVPGKIKNWNFLNNQLDAYTFSGHKFGAFKGVGFSFFKPDFEFSPLLSGGGQQGGLRSGTENPMGIYSLKLALEDLILGFNFEKILEAKKYIENSLIEILGNKGEIVAYNAKMRNLNTIYFIQKMIHPEILKMKFDLGGMDVGLGSACSSGSPLPDRIILALGYDNESAKSGIRLSFEPYLELETAKIYFEKIKSVFKNSLK